MTGHVDTGIVGHVRRNTKLLRTHIYSSQVKKRLEKRFKDPSDALRLVIVRDVWLNNLPERNLAVELLERLLEGEIKSKFATNIVQQKKFSELLGNVITRYQNRSIETAQVMRN